MFPAQRVSFAGCLSGRVTLHLLLLHTAMRVGANPVLLQACVPAVGILPWCYILVMRQGRVPPVATDIPTAVHDSHVCTSPTQGSLVLLSLLGRCMPACIP
jgi:hypothetical protein